jgi:hypothetical protein
VCRGRSVVPSLGPRREPAVLSVVAVIRKRHFGTNQENLSIVEDNSAVVWHCLVHDGSERVQVGTEVFNQQADVTNNSLCMFR